MPLFVPGEIFPGVLQARLKDFRLRRHLSPLSSPGEKPEQIKNDDEPVKNGESSRNESHSASRNISDDLENLRPGILSSSTLIASSFVMLFPTTVPYRAPLIQRSHPG